MFAFTQLLTIMSIYLYFTNVLLFNVSKSSAIRLSKIIMSFLFSNRPTFRGLIIFKLSNTATVMSQLFQQQCHTIVDWHDLVPYENGTY